MPISAFVVVVVVVVDAVVGIVAVVLLVSAAGVAMAFAPLIGSCHSHAKKCCAPIKPATL